MDISPEDIGLPFVVRLAQMVEADPDAARIELVALDGTLRRLTLRELELGSNQVARVLQTQGVGLGDRVGLELRNSAELILLILAAWKVGAAPVPMRWDLPDWERARVRSVLGAAVTVTEADLSFFDKAATELDEPLPVVTSPRLGGICSSGSTGTPKVIMDWRPAIVSEITGQPFPTGWGVEIGRQTILVPTAMYHTNGFATMMNFLAGDTLVIMEKFDAGLLVDLVEKREITTFTATPTMLARVGRLPDIEQRDFSSLEYIHQGAAIFPPALVRRWIDLVGAERLYMAYGMTERIGLTSIRGDEWLLHPGSVGRGFRDTEIRILDPEQKPVATGEVGEIYLRSSTTGQYGYLGGAEPLPMTDDGFATAGDLGWVDDDGFLYIADRRVDMIVTGGANVFPAEVEAALSEHAGVADVVVIGLSDPEWGRRVHAIIEPTNPSDPPSGDDLREFAKSRLAAYKVPKSIEYVPAIPRSAATKVNRGQLVADREGVSEGGP